MNEVINEWNIYSLQYLMLYSTVQTLRCMLSERKMNHNKIMQIGQFSNE